MAKVNIKLENLSEMFPNSWTDEQKAKGNTLFLKYLSEKAHKFYGGKVQTVPKAPVPGFNWFNVWYTPGVSKVSTTIRDNNDTSFELTNRGNLVAVVSDSTRVLGDGDCTPPGGLGVMEGKAFLMKYLGGVDAVALCIDSKGKDGKNDPEKIIDFVKMCQHSFGAVNLEDISQPNCYRVLDVLREECIIPVWHDDAQGTACVTLAGLLNALKLANKKMSNAKMVLFGAGAANTTIARLIIADGGDPHNMVIFDSHGGLHKNREDIKADHRFYRKWELCEQTNPQCINTMEEAMRNADVLISVSTPGPDTIKQEWVKLMAPKSVVFACANPVPEIYPYAAKEAGAYIVATGRGDFPNQVNNSIGFPGILKGALIARASKITDSMAIAAAHSLAGFAEKRGISPENIVPTMDEADVFPVEAADVAVQAVKEGVARRQVSWEEAYRIAKKDIESSRSMTKALYDNGYIANPPAEMLEDALLWTIQQVEAKK
ncbi:MAG TPA: NADP-dependent malic enzyme [Tenuifilaceae bacterium]|jgi:malate dehydrogenase (oxaloacetate-decarboxylating)|nr:NADP-dependent malic enzyme [Tenuifilaceae bacterium]HOA09308.1 NADP-dependent malic enzyme [Tenuifilaceae bacterium]HOC36038.1 NADP-dependent malic enzyme [Tenuifilaceae bacterium]HOG71900.1 NADP-dependent malic enzyme [Tenuifilaceae bacterium]HOW20310.1 NADP-dependent malic enzyme [Tenuifilaceae bacterium]